MKTTPCGGDMKNLKKQMRNHHSMDEMQRRDWLQIIYPVTIYN